jgi:hypothetical protein
MKPMEKFFQELQVHLTDSEQNGFWKKRSEKKSGWSGTENETWGPPPFLKNDSH